MSYTVRNLMIAIALAVVGIMLTSSYIRGQKAQLERGKEQVKVLVATKDIPAGTSSSTLQEAGYVELKSVARENAAPQALADLKDVEKLSLAVNVYTGEQITARKFETKSGLNPTEQIKGTERLAALPIQPTGGVASLIKPGDRVDVYASNKMKVQNEDDIPVTWVVARDVLVLHTPTSLQAEAMPTEGGEAPPTNAAAAANATGDPQLFVLQGSDKVMQDLIWSYAHSDQTKLIFLLRPSDGDQETKLKPQVTIPDVS